MSESHSVLYSRTGDVGWVTLNRPDAMNALDLPMLEKLREALIEAREDSRARVVLLTGEGKAFCAGGDVRYMASLGADVEKGLRDMVGLLNLSVLELCGMPKPHVAVLNGAAAGAGLSLALACDYRIMSERASVAVAYPACGLTPDGGLTWFLPRVVGIARAQEMILLNPRLSSESALAWGLVHRVLPEQELPTAAAQFAGQLAQAATHAVAETRRLFIGGFGRSLAEQLDREVQSVAAAAASSEGKLGLRALSAGLRPVFHTPEGA